MRSFRPNNSIDVADLLTQDIAVEKQNAVQRLVLRGSAYMGFTGEAGEELGNFFFAHLGRMPFVVEKDEPLDPVNVALFSFGTIMPRPDCVADLIEQFGLLRGRRCRRYVFKSETAVDHGERAVYRSVRVY